MNGIPTPTLNKPLVTVLSGLIGIWPLHTSRVAVCNIKGKPAGYFNCIQILRSLFVVMYKGTRLRDFVCPNVEPIERTSEVIESLIGLIS